MSTKSNRFGGKILEQNYFWQNVKFDTVRGRVQRYYIIALQPVNNFSTRAIRLPIIRKRSVKQHKIISNARYTYCIKNSVK